MAEIYGNFYLNLSQMYGNAEIILGILGSAGWTKNAVAGALGNMQRESTINPGIWQNLSAGNTRLGFGLVQWTPATNYINWAQSNGYVTYDQYGRLAPQCARIEYERANGLQYSATSDYPLSFNEFVASGQTPEYLASAFLRNYERAGVAAESERQKNARYWYDILEGGVIPGPDPGGEDKRKHGRVWRYDIFA